MKQFLLFGYGTYYPSGGMRDFKESYDTEEEANAAIRFTWRWSPILQIKDGEQSEPRNKYDT